jgi:hypothetical protein
LGNTLQHIDELGREIATGETFLRESPRGNPGAPAPFRVSGQGLQSIGESGGVTRRHHDAGAGLLNHRR